MTAIGTKPTYPRRAADVPSLRISGHRDGALRQDLIVRARRSVKVSVSGWASEFNIEKIDGKKHSLTASTLAQKSQTRRTRVTRSRRQRNRVWFSTFDREAPL